jgi:mannan endo-1,4-beta-mannosidase
MPSNPTFYVSGRFLHDRFGTKILLRGINLPLLDDWDFPDSDYLDAVAQSGANAVRIQWYVNYPQPPADQPQRQSYSLADLDTLLHRCAAAEMIPVLMLADLTCAPDTSQLNNLLVAWWTDPEVVVVLQKHTKYLIINIGNEVGYYHWSGDSSDTLATYIADYSSAIAGIRHAGLNVPLMIDATDCGTSLDIFTTTGKQLIDADPLKNILLSAHAYWAGYDGLGHIDACVQAGLPIIFGEVSNLQDGDTAGTYVSLDANGNNPWPPASNLFTYQALLAAAIHHEIGWLAWSWGPDDSPDRKLSTDGTFASLTPWGEDFLDNPGYGLVSRSKRHVLLPLA